jgi:hypothetical protein
MPGGHGHVTPRLDGMLARCGGPAMCGECARERMETGKPVLTGLTLTLNCEDWPEAPVVSLRRIGWLDQLGRVWLRSADWDLKGAPLAPLLTDPGSSESGVPSARS